MNRFLFISIFMLAFGLQANARTFKVKGALAEHLFNTINAFDSVPGLGGTVDCAMGTCSAELHGVLCLKNVNQADGILPYVSCTVDSTGSNGRVEVYSRDVAAASTLRRALNEIIGFDSRSRYQTRTSATSISCTAHAINRELDSVRVESTFECSIIK